MIASPVPRASRRFVFLGPSLLAALLLALPALAADDDEKKDKEPAKAEVKEKDAFHPSKASTKGLVELTIADVLAKPQPEGVDDLKAIQGQVKRVLDKVMPAVVGLQVGGASGSGVLVSEDGYVLTAGHVSGRPDSAVTVITPDGKRHKAKSLGNNGAVDSGLIKITDEGTFPFVPMGASGELKKNAWCVSVGHPGGVKQGRSPVVRVGRVMELQKTFVRTDCVLVGGDSGGPLFDLEGRVIGIHSRIGPSITSNMHVPVDTYRTTWDRLAAGEVWGGGVGRPATTDAYLGVQFGLGDTGPKIEEVVKDSPAEAAGLKAQDVVQMFEGKAVDDLDSIRSLLAKKKPGDKVEMTVLRDGEAMTFKIELGRRPR